MDYNLLIFLSEKQDAQKLVELLKDTGIDAYVEDKTSDPSDPQWNVMVDENKALKAQNVLEQFYDDKEKQEKAKREAERLKDPRYRNKSNGSQSSSFKPSWTVIALAIFLTGLTGAGLRYYFKDQERIRQQKLIDQKYGADEEEYYRFIAEQDSLNALKESGLTLELFKESILSEFKGKPVKLDDGITLNKVSTDGTTILFEGEFHEGYEVDHPDNIFKSNLRNALLESFHYAFLTEKDVYGNDYFDQLEELGVTLQFDFYNHGETKPAVTCRFTGSDLNKMEKKKKK